MEEEGGAQPVAATLGGALMLLRSLCQPLLAGPRVVLDFVLTQLLGSMLLGISLLLYTCSWGASLAAYLGGILG